MTSQGRLDNMRAGSLRDLRPTARLTVLAMILWAVVDVLHTIIAVGHYEHRITVVTHGNADVLPACSPQP